MTGRRHRAAGVTLVEVLVCTVLLGVFCTLMATTMVLAHRNYYMNSNRLVGYRNVMDALDRMSRHLALCVQMAQPQPFCPCYLPGACYCCRCDNQIRHFDPVVVAAAGSAGGQSPPLVFAYPSYQLSLTGCGGGGGSNQLYVGYARDASANTLVELTYGQTYTTGAAPLSTHVLARDITGFEVTHYPPQSGSGLHSFGLLLTFTLPDVQGRVDTSGSTGLLQLSNLVPAQVGEARTMRRRGVSLLELMVGMLLMFAAGVTMATVVASTSHFLLQERLRSIALQEGWAESNTLLAAFNGYQRSNLSAVKSQSEQFCKIPYGAGTNANIGGPLVYNGMDPGYAQDGWGITMTMMASVPYDLTGDPAPQSTLLVGQTLKTCHPIHDITTINGGTQVLFVGLDPLCQVFVYTVGGGTTPMQVMPLIPNPPPAPPYQPEASALLYTGGTVLTADDPTLHRFYDAPCPAGGTAWQTASHLAILPDGVGSEATNAPAGLAWDGTNVWCVDQYIRGVWEWTGAAWGGPYAPVEPPLMAPYQAAYDTHDKVLWITDVGDVCLRSFISGGLGTWSGLLRAPTMGSPRGVTVDGVGGVYTADALSLWYYSPGRVWSVAASLPLALQYEVNSLHFDIPTSTLWIDTDSEHVVRLYSYTVAGGFQPATSDP